MNELQKRYIETQYAYIMSNDPGSYVWKKLEEEAANKTEAEMLEALDEDGSDD